METFAIGFSSRTVHLACPPEELTSMPGIVCVERINFETGFHDIFLPITIPNVVALRIMGLITVNDSKRMIKKSNNTVIQ